MNFIEFQLRTICSFEDHVPHHGYPRTGKHRAYVACVQMDTY